MKIKIIINQVQIIHGALSFASLPPVAKVSCAGLMVTLNPFTIETFLKYLARIELTLIYMSNLLM